MVPRDPESIKLLADDAEDLAMSWGKPAGLMAYTSVDFVVFWFFSRYVFLRAFCAFKQGDKQPVWRKRAAHALVLANV